MSSDRILALKQQRGYYAAFGQTEKVKAADKEIAELRAKRKAESAPVPEPEVEPAAQVETAKADTSSVENTSARQPRQRKPKG